MKPRIDYRKTAPDGISALSGLENYVRQSCLEPALLELVKLRASQINGCSYCIDMHTKDASTEGTSAGVSNDGPECHSWSSVSHAPRQREAADFDGGPFYACAAGIHRFTPSKWRETVDRRPNDSTLSPQSAVQPPGIVARLKT